MNIWILLVGKWSISIFHIFRSKIRNENEAFFILIQSQLLNIFSMKRKKKMIEFPRYNSNKSTHTNCMTFPIHIGSSKCRKSYGFNFILFSPTFQSVTFQFHMAYTQKANYHFTPRRIEIWTTPSLELKASCFIQFQI